MPTLVFDIETLGEDFDSLDATTQKSLTRWIREDSLSPEEYDATLRGVKEGLGFSPFTGSVVSIAIRDLERGRGAVYFVAPGSDVEMFEEENVVYRPLSEEELLRQFWEAASKYSSVVTFNGRGFDAPFLAVRSAVYGIRPSIDLLANRYLNYQQRVKHIDLQDQLTFYGAVRRRPSLHLACRAFGIESPKSDGVDGHEVAGLFRDGRFLDIARYNMEDVRATAELYEKWRDFIAF